MSGDATQTDPFTEGFRHPPEYVTGPCSTYMVRVMELRRLVGFYFMFVKTSQKLGTLIPKEAKETAGAKGMQIFEYSYSDQRPLVNQLMLSRAVESFDLYLTTILRDIFLSRPEMLKSEGTIDVATVIETGNYENLIWRIVERKVHDLSYKPLSELRKFIESRTGIDLFPSAEAFETTALVSEVRNLIAHNDCVINDLFKAKTKGIAMPLEVSDTGRINIDDVWLRRASYTLDAVVFRFDELAAKKFDLRTQWYALNSLKKILPDISLNEAPFIQSAGPQVPKIGG
jgi:hypothetical protein